MIERGLAAAHELVYSCRRTFARPAANPEHLRRPVGGDASQGARDLKYTTLAAGALALACAHTAFAASDLANDVRACASSDPDVAIAACTRAMESGELSKETLAEDLFRRSNAYTVRGDRTRALEDYRAAIRVTPQAKDVYNNRGLAWLERGDLDRAKADFDAMVVYYPHEHRGFHNRAIVFERQGDIDHAIEDTMEAIRLGPPTNSLSWFSLGALWLDKRDADRAIAALDEAIRQESDDHRFWRVRGDAWLLKGDNDRALADLNEAVRLKPDAWGTYADRALVWAAKDDFEHVLRDTGEAARRYPAKTATDYKARGLMHLETGNYEGARADFDRALQLDAKIRGAGYVLVWREIARRRGDLPATSGAEPVLPPVDPNTWPGTLLRLTKGEIDAATVRRMAEEGDASTRRNRVCELDYYEGELSIAAGDVKGARTLLASAVDECPAGFIERSAAAVALARMGK